MKKRSQPTNISSIDPGANKNKSITYREKLRKKGDTIVNLQTDDKGISDIFIKRQNHVIAEKKRTIKHDEPLVKYHKRRMNKRGAHGERRPHGYWCCLNVNIKLWKAGQPLKLYGLTRFYGNMNMHVCAHNSKLSDLHPWFVANYAIFKDDVHLYAPLATCGDYFNWYGAHENGFGKSCLVKLRKATTVQLDAVHLKDYKEYLEQHLKKLGQRATVNSIENNQTFLLPFGSKWVDYTADQEGLTP